MILSRDKLKSIALLGVAIFIPFTMSIGNAAIILATLITIVFFKKENLSKLKSYQYLFPFLFFAVVVIWAFFGDDFKSGVSRLDRHFLPLLLTLIVINYNWDKRLRTKVVCYFSWATTFSGLLLLIFAFIKMFKGESIQEISFHAFTEPYDQHPVYFSLMATLALFYFLIKILERQKIIEFAATFMLLMVLLLCASKAVLFIDLTLLIGYLIKVTRNWKQRLVFFFATSFILIGVLKVQFLKQRFLEGLLISEFVWDFEPSNDFALKKQFSYQEKMALSDLDLRLLMAEISTYHLKEDSNLLFGYGPSMAQDYFDYYLHTYNLAPNWFEGFNVHNQFLHFLINYGILIVLIFCGYIFFILKEILKRKEFLPIVFFSSTLFVFFFEVLLIRNKGIVFFYFFTLLFISNSEYFEDRNLRN